METDGEPLESPWHRAAINLLIDVIVWLLHGRTDYFVGGNMFLYFSNQQTRRHQYRGPDFFFVKDVDGTRERLYWWIFEEDGRFPDVIIELLSPTTAKEDRTTKKDLYEKTFRTQEYYCYDPDTKQLEGWRLVNMRYQAITPDERGWLPCQELGLWLGTWEGSYLEKHATWLRFYDAQGQLLYTKAEAAETELARLKTEADVSEAELARLKTEAETAGAELASLKAEAETAGAELASLKVEAETAGAELASLKAWFKQQGIPLPSENGPPK